MTRQGGFSPKIEDSVFRAYPNHGSDRGIVHTTECSSIKYVDLCSRETCDAHHELLVDMQNPW